MSFDPLALLMAEPTEEMVAEYEAAQAEIEARKAERAAQAAKVRKCRRCNGRGILPQFRHVSGGVCFACDGDGEVVIN